MEMEDSQGWNFNAPQFVDFNSLHGDDTDNAEQYFEFDHENGVPVHMNGDELNEMDIELRKDCKAEGTKVRGTKSTLLKMLGEKPTAKLPNTSQSLSSKSPRLTRSSTRNSGAEIPLKTETGKPESCSQSHGGISETRPNHARSGNPSNRDIKAKPIGAQQVGVKRSASLRTVCPQTGSPAKPSRTWKTLSSDKTETGPKESNQSKLRGKSRPSPLNVLKRNPVKIVQHPTAKNTEDLELEKIAHFREELVKKKKLAMDSCKVALSGKAFVPLTVERKQLTKPEGFKFETDARIKTHKLETRNDAQVKDFASILRANKAASVSAVKLGPTKPEPFKLTSQRKRKLADLDEKQAEEYETMAEKVAAFTRTPDRFRSKPKDSRGRSHSPPPAITIPQTPQLETQTRHRPVTAPSREMLEQKELDEMQKHQFKAHPLNQKILQCASIKKVPSKPPTVIEEFSFSSNNNKVLHKDRAKEEEIFEFHAQPLNKKILEGPVGVKEPKKLPVTVPESPAFALKLRARIPLVEEVKEEKSRYQPRSVPHYGIPFQPKCEHRITAAEPFGFEEREKQRAEQKAKMIEQIYEDTHLEEKVWKSFSIPHTGVPFQPVLVHKATVVEPFSFEERDKLMLEKKEEKIIEILESEKKQREFHANPIPVLEPHLPPKISRPLTVHNPFNLDTELRGAKKAEEWSKKIEEELAQQKEMAKFKARIATVLEQEPFVPHKENKHTTDISEFELNTAKRVIKRELFEMNKKAKQDELDNIHHQEQLLKEAEEKAEIENLRREAVHKANPIKHYKSVSVKRSDKPLTAPLSPVFLTDNRLRSRAHHADTFMSNDK